MEAEADVSDAAGRDDAGRIRMDDWELAPEIQAMVKANWGKVSQENLDKSWNAGGKLPLGEIPKSVLNLDLLKELKSECGGLQTLLRNHNHIFIVIKGDVRLRHPLADHHDLGKKNPSKNSAKFKGTKPCWFYENHPQGCPAKDCFWLHQNKN